MSKNIDQNTKVPLNALPPVSMDLFLQQSGFSPATAWRYRKKGWLRTVTICGRQYLTRQAIAEFNERAARGEFAGRIQNPAAAHANAPKPGQKCGQRHHASGGNTSEP